MTKEKSRLDACGWNSFRTELFFKDEGRKKRDIGKNILSIIQKYSKGKRVLELCSGGGKLLIQLARAGLQVTGVDLSKDMLEICQEEVKKESTDVQDRIQLVLDDMCTFHIGNKFDFIILEDDGFVYLLTQEDQLACLKRVHDYLENTGLFFLSFTTPHKELNSSDEFEYDPAAQIITQPCVWTISDEKGVHKTVKQGIERRRMTYPQELELLLSMSKLTPVHRWGDLQMHPFTDPLTQEYNYLIKKQTS
jgi:SAM-dependent methyltransferase